VVFLLAITANICLNVSDGAASSCPEVDEGGTFLLDCHRLLFVGNHCTNQSGVRRNDSPALVHPEGAPEGDAQLAEPAAGTSIRKWLSNLLGGNNNEKIDNDVGHEAGGELGGYSHADGHVHSHGEAKPVPPVQMPTAPPIVSAAPKPHTGAERDGC
jgi:hypothetical protein